MFKETIKFMTLKSKFDGSPLYYELNQPTNLTEEQKGKYGVLGTDKLEKLKEEEDNER